MNKIFFASILIIALVLIAGAGYLFFSITPSTTPVQVQTTSLPVADNSVSLDSSNFPAGTVVTSGSLSVPTTIDDKSIIIRDFTGDASTTQDATDPQLFYLVGQATTSPFSISYTTATHLFVVTLNKEPLGTIRGDAEQFLLEALAVQPTDVCLLATDVVAASGTNPLYEGKNLGFSFCPGATQLPQ